MIRPSIPELTHSIVQRYGVDHAGRCDCPTCNVRRLKASIDNLSAKYGDRVIPFPAKSDVGGAA